MLVSAACIVAAVLMVWTHRQKLAAGVAQALRWETAALVWLTLFGVTLLHECAHGLTCKHFGGEVHEIGVLLLFLMPSFYCNVSDAWLFRERSRRLWVTFAGGYFELFLWALAVFVWRLTLPGTLVNNLAFVVLSIGGVQTLLNFNPLLKLDGYYLLSDALEIPNLQQRAFDTFKGSLRRLLWGGPPPEPEPRGRLLLGFGLATWLFSLVFLALVLAALARVAGPHWGWVGLGGVALVGLAGTRGLFRGCSAGEVGNMIRLRHRRTAAWVLAAGGLAAGLCVIEVEDRAGGAFQVRAVTRAEVRAPAAGFVREVYFEEGDRVSPGAAVARLEVPDLARANQEFRSLGDRLLLSAFGSDDKADRLRRLAAEKAGR